MAKSPALEWLWQYLRDNPHPHILDCAPFRAPTAELLLRRGAKLYAADLITPLVEGDPGLWDRSHKTPSFRTENFLAQMPQIPSGTLSLVLCWQVLDLLPRESLATFILHMYLYLRSGGVFFCILREPYLPSGAESIWCLDNLTTLKKDGEGAKRFPYPPITGREIERLLPTGNIKTFLTRSGFREVLAMK